MVAPPVARRRHTRSTSTGTSTAARLICKGDGAGDGVGDDCGPSIWSADIVNLSKLKFG